jgi:8-oxo-dGTP diphosphatase
MTITNIRHVDFVNSYDAPTNTHYVNLIVVADWVAGEAELREPEKCTEWRWIEWPNVPQPHFVSITGMLDAGITF